jgi:hypothetical protein
LKIRPSDEGEVRWWLTRSGKDEDDLRIRACGGDLDVAGKMDLPMVQGWYQDWSSVLAGSDFKKTFLATWTLRLEESSEATQIACWNLLTQMIARVLSQNRFFVDIGLISMEARNLAQNGSMNKMLLTTMLFKVYSIAKTIITRVSK